MESRVRTPCIGVCSTVFGDHVCRGCKRYAHEVIDWNGYSEPQKRLVEQRLGQLLLQVVTDKWRVTDADCLRRRLRAQGIAYSPERDPRCWVLDLLRRAASRVEQPQDWGFEVLPQWRGLGLDGLRQRVDQEFFELSEAHYQRYLQPRIDQHAEL